MRFFLCIGKEQYAFKILQGTRARIWLLMRSKKAHTAFFKFQIEDFKCA
jgi:hypothetical protein